MKNIIEAAWENRSLLKDKKTQEVIRSVINQLDEGKLRVAEPIGDKWQVNEWTQSLGTVPGEFWSDIESDDPGSLKDVIQSLSSLVSLLRS